VVVFSPSKAIHGQISAHLTSVISHFRPESVRKLRQVDKAIYGLSWLSPKETKMKHVVRTLGVAAMMFASAASHATHLSFWSWRVEDKMFYEAVAQ
jgi:hypothetical protein